MRTSGHVAHCSPGSIVLTADAAALLAAHLRTRRPPDNPATRLIIADLQRMSFTGHVSRDTTRLNPLAERSSISVADAARVLGITPGAVRRRIYRQQLAATFDGRNWRINPHELKGSS